MHSWVASPLSVHGGASWHEHFNQQLSLLQEAVFDSSAQACPLCVFLVFKGLRTTLTPSTRQREASATPSLCEAMIQCKNNGIIRRDTEKFRALPPLPAGCLKGLVEIQDADAVRSPPLEKRGRHAACQAVHVIECEVEGTARAQVDVAPGRPRWHVHVHVVAGYAQLARRGQAAQQHLARSRHTLRPCQDFPFRLSCWRVGRARCYAKAIVVPWGSQGKSMLQAQVQAADALCRAPSFRAASIGSSIDSAIDSAVNVAVDAEQNQPRDLSRPVHMQTPQRCTRKRVFPIKQGD